MFLVFAEFGQHKVFVSILYHADTPRIDKEKQRISLEVHDLLHIGCTLNTVQVDLLFVCDPADVLIRQVLQTDIYVVLVLQTVF